MASLADDKLNNLGGKLSLADIEAWFNSPERDHLPDHVEAAILNLLMMTLKRTVNTEPDTREEAILKSVYNHPKHYRALVRYLKQHGKNAFDLMTYIGEGSTVAHRIWEMYSTDGERLLAEPHPFEVIAENTMTMYERHPPVEPVKFKTSYLPCPGCGADRTDRKYTCEKCGYVFEVEV